MNYRINILVVTVIGMVLSAPEAVAKTDFFYKEMNLIGGYSDIHKTVGKKGQLLKNSIGFEYFKKFSNDYGDFLTADIQARLAYDSIEDRKDAWGLEIHNAWLEYKLGLGKYVRVGHFDPSFGLEPLRDTHGTLMQTLAIRNIGYKKDWGVGYRGIVGAYDFQAAVQLGSGMGIRHKDDNFLLTARLGSSDKEDFQYGLSLMYGQILEALETKTIPVAKLRSDKAVKKQRVGLDAQYRRGAYQWSSEVVYGEDEDAEIVGAWSELQYTVPSKQELSFQLQTQMWLNDISAGDTEEVTISAGASYDLNAEMTVRLGYFHDVEQFNKARDKLVLLQFYYFGF